MNIKKIVPFLLLLAMPSVLFAARPSINQLNTRVNQAEADITQLQTDVVQLQTEDVTLHSRIDAIESLPVGADPGDVLYWDGSVWQLTPKASTTTFGAGPPPMLTLCNGVPTWTSTACRSYVIGDTGPAGGIVFYVTDGGIHGLEAAPTDHQDLVPFGCVSINIIGAEGEIVGTGSQNTADIVAGCPDAGIAAKVADAYVLNYYYDDWFLPSKDELNLLYQQRNIVGAANQPYWSSTELFNDSSSAMGQDFLGGGQFTYSKGTFTTLSVRAIRAF